MTGALTRSRPRPTARIVHLGLGAFHRAHQAAFTDAVDVDRAWGIVAFTGRTPDAAATLAAQDGLYTLVERDASGDRSRVIESIVEARDGADRYELRRRVADPSTAVVTLTVTESAYCLDASRALDVTNPAVTADVAALRSGGHPTTMPGRLVDALRARFELGVDPIAVVSCDNLARNGAAARAAVLGLARLVDDTVADRIEAGVSFVDSSVDRITPRTTPHDIGDVRLSTGLADLAPVITEPYTSWVISGDFPAGRPPWENVGVQFVDDIEPYERRKLWLLNGAHSLLAYEGLLRGCTTVAEAVSVPDLLAAVERLWDEAGRHLTHVALDIPGYRQSLRERFSNARIAHHLGQIALDGAVKLRTRIVPVVRAELAAGRNASAACRVIAAWALYTGRFGATVGDAEGSVLEVALRSSEPTSALLSVLDSDLARHPLVRDTVAAEVAALSQLIPSAAIPTRYPVRQEPS